MGCPDGRTWALINASSTSPIGRIWTIWAPRKLIYCRAMFTKAKLQGWVRVIVWNTFQKSMDIRLKLSDWHMYLGVWTIEIPRNQI